MQSLPRSSHWTPERFILGLTRVHRQWRRDRRRGKSAGFHFNSVYCKQHGLGRPMNLCVSAGAFPAILARCPPEVKADWRVDTAREWDAEHILARCRLLFAHWKKHGQRAGLSWNQNYFERNGAAGLLRSLTRNRLRIEFFVRRIGGEMFDCWKPVPRPWEPSRVRAILREAHERWVHDTEYGRSAGYRFCRYYLMRRGYIGVLRHVESRVHGGLDAFVQMIPEIVADWFYQPRYTVAELRRMVGVALERWRRDRAAQEARVRFGPTYVRAIGEHRLLHALERKGWRRVFAHPSMAQVRRIWGKKIPGSQIRDIRKLRAAYFVQARSNARYINRTRSDT